MALISGCSHSPLYNPSSEPVKSLWVWETLVINDNNIRQEFFDFCREEEIKLIFLYVGDCFFESGISNSETHVSEESLVSFLEEANNNKIKVHALDGEADWAYSKRHPVPVERLRKMLQFNGNQATKSRLHGVQWDIEPYLLNEFGTVRWQNVLKQYLDLVSELKDIVQDYEDTFEMGFAIPFWWDHRSSDVSQVEWQGECKPAAYHLMDMLECLKGAYIAIMDYRNFVFGPNGSFNHALDEIEYAESNNLQIGIFIGQETGEVKGEPEIISFWMLGKPALDKAIYQLMEAFRNYRCFKGVSIHHYGSLRELAVGGE